MTGPQRQDRPDRPIVIVSNRPLIVSAFATTADRHGHPSVVFDFADPAGRVREILPPPACVLVDVCGDPDAAVWTCTALDRLGTEPVVLLLTADRSLAPAHLSALLRCRPAGILGAATTPEEFIRTLRLVMQGQVVLQLDRGGDGGRLLERSLWHCADPLPAPDLTSEEHGLLEMVACGLSDEEIAAKLYLSEATVRRRVFSLRRKTATTKRVELAAWGGAHGYYQPRSADWRPTLDDPFPPPALPRVR